MTAKVVMVQGTGSSVGKSLLVAALCRLLHQEGYRVAPFKAQNMALNAAVTEEGLEIGRATAVQAEAAGIEPSVDMNPILLKPEADSRCQVVLMGRPLESLPAHAYYERKQQFWEAVRAALARLRERYDVVVIEGAGSPAEINLREGDLVNMRVALHAQAPVLLVGDIDRGGVFASLLGTLMLLDPEERALVKGLVINKFRGDLALLGSGLRMLEERAGVPVLGIVPYLRDLLISEEDSAGLEATSGGSALLDVAVIRLPRISNFDDFDLLAAEPAVSLRYVTDPTRLGRPDLVILPGSKGTVADLRFLRESGLAAPIIALAVTGTAVLGICGGYQMMGERILDPAHVESDEVETAGLGLLPAVTTFASEKRTVRVSATVVGGSGPFASAASQEITAYEIHMGTTVHRGQPMFRLDDWERDRGPEEDGQDRQDAGSGHGDAEMRGRGEGLEDVGRGMNPRRQDPSTDERGLAQMADVNRGVEASAGQEAEASSGPGIDASAGRAAGASGSPSSSPAKASIPGDEGAAGHKTTPYGIGDQAVGQSAPPYEDEAGRGEVMDRRLEPAPTHHSSPITHHSTQSSIPEGCAVGNGALIGTYLHGLFENPCLRRALIDWLVARRGLAPLQWEETSRRREAEYDRLADALRAAVDLPSLYRIIGLEGR